jgi:dTDP-4-dehydrorhamnose 3,5-epimerase
MHFARPPHAETKIVRCTAGAIHDVIVDIRRDSPTYLATAGMELSAENRCALYIPPGFAHGFQTLRDDTEVLYMIDVPYVPGAAAGIRWNDPAVEVVWPEPVTVIAARDLAFADWA